MDSAQSFWHLYQKGFPIRSPPDQRVFATPRGISVLTPSFIASPNLVILHKPLMTLTSEFIKLYIKLSKNGFAYLTQ